VDDGTPRRAILGVMPRRRSTPAAGVVVALVQSAQVHAHLCEALPKPVSFAMASLVPRRSSVVFGWASLRIFTWAFPAGAFGRGGWVTRWCTQPR
jgi:hypothetical protein